MNACLFDADIESTNGWRSLASANGLHLDTFPAWLGIASIPENNDLVILDHSAVEMQFVPVVLELCRHRPKQLVIVSGHQLSIPIVVELMRGGAVSVLEKPAELAHMREELQRILPIVRSHHESKVDYERLAALFNSLTKKELSVLNLVLEGVSNKDSAKLLNVSVRTVESRRSKLHKKLDSSHLVDLVQKMDHLNLLRASFAPSAEPPKGKLAKHVPPHMHMNQDKTTNVARDRLQDQA